MKKLDFKEFFARLCAVAVVALVLFFAIDFIRFPECYLTTWRYQLQNDIKQGDEMAIEYYETTYLANNRILFD